MTSPVPQLSEARFQLVARDPRMIAEWMEKVAHGPVHVSMEGVASYVNLEPEPYGGGSELRVDVVANGQPIVTPLLREVPEPYHHTPQDLVEVHGRNHLVARLEGCARCGGTHTKILFTPLDVPIHDPSGDFTHWAPCPDAAGQPILQRVKT